MLAYISYFSTSFTIALIAWPFISLLLTLPILAMLYHRHRELRLASVMSAYLSILYLLGLVAFTLYPMPDDPVAYCASHHIEPQLNPLRFIEDIRTDGLFGFLQLALNVVFFMPLGFILTRWVRFKPWITFAVGVGVSAVIELTQLTGFWGFYPCAYRQFDVNDLMTNALGTLAGIGLALLLARVAPVRTVDETTVSTAPGLVHRTVTFAIDMLFINLTYMPFGLALVFAFHELAEPLPNGDFRLLGITVGVEVTNVTVAVLMALTFLFYEVWIPVNHSGQTLGGMFTHMSVETKHRGGLLRAMFYVARTAVLYLLVGVGFDLPQYTEPLVVLGLLVFWFIKHQMPYDLIPGESVTGTQLGDTKSNP